MRSRCLNGADLTGMYGGRCSFSDFKVFSRGDAKFGDTGHLHDSNSCSDGRRVYITAFL